MATHIIPIYGDWVVEFQVTANDVHFRRYKKKRYAKAKNENRREDRPNEFIPTRALQTIGLLLLQDQLGKVQVDAIAQNLCIDLREVRTTP